MVICRVAIYSDRYRHHQGSFDKRHGAALHQAAASPDCVSKKNKKLNDCLDRSHLTADLAVDFSLQSKEEEEVVKGCFCLSHRSIRTLGGCFPFRSYQEARGVFSRPADSSVKDTGVWSIFSRSRTEGHVSDIDLTCSRLIVAHLPTGRTTDKGCQAHSPTL